MTTEQMIEEALKEFDEYNANAGGVLYPNRNSAWLKEKLTTIATKSAEESVNEIGNLINSTKNDTEKLDLVVKYLNKDTNEQNRLGSHHTRTHIYLYWFID